VLDEGEQLSGDGGKGRARGLLEEGRDSGVGLEDQVEEVRFVDLALGRTINPS
jgi:hypothetical protein